jgi:cytochrome d ubiquinol oxidase subunit II
MKTENAVRGRVRRAGRRAFLAYVAAWLAVTLLSRSSAPHLWAVYERTAASWLAPVVFLASIVTLRWATARGRPALAFTSSSFSIAALIGIMGQGLYPWLLPALGEAGGGLTVFNAASSPLTLKAMLVIALLGIPLVVAYTVFIYRVFRGPVVLDDVSY